MLKVLVQLGFIYSRVIIQMKIEQMSNLSVNVSLCDCTIIKKKMYTKYLVFDTKYLYRIC